MIVSQAHTASPAKAEAAATAHAHSATAQIEAAATAQTSVTREAAHELGSAAQANDRLLADWRATGHSLGNAGCDAGREEIFTEGEVLAGRSGGRHGFRIVGGQ